MAFSTIRIQHKGGDQDGLRLRWTKKINRLLLICKPLLVCRGIMASFGLCVNDRMGPKAKYSKTSITGAHKKAPMKEETLIETNHSDNFVPRQKTPTKITSSHSFYHSSALLALWGRIRNKPLKPTGQAISSKPSYEINCACAESRLCWRVVEDGEVLWKKSCYAV